MGWPGRKSRPFCFCRRARPAERPVSHTGDNGFNSHLRRHGAEHERMSAFSFKEVIVGSAPTCATKPRSSNGRTPDFDSGDHSGSNPCRGAKSFLSTQAFSGILGVKISLLYRSVGDRLDWKSAGLQTRHYRVQISGLLPYGRSSVGRAVVP